MKILLMIRDRQALCGGDRARDDALSIVEAGIEAVLPSSIMKNSVALDRDILRVGRHAFDLTRYRRIFVAGGGKASASMAIELEYLLGDRIYAGFVIDRRIPEAVPAKTRICAGSHPVPAHSGVACVKKMLRMLEEATPSDLVILLISGGGSALMPLPATGISLEDKVRLTEILLNSGADIKEMNKVRKHISAIKGGQLLKQMGGASVIALIMSDVVGDDISSIASGLVAPDVSTFQEALEVIRSRDLIESAPANILNYLAKGAKGMIPETPKPGEEIFSTVTSVIVASGQLAVMAAAEKAKGLGYEPLVLGSRIMGESREIGLALAGIGRECLDSGLPVKPPAAIISGGETTVTVRNGGKGGRNQELVLGFLSYYENGMTAVAVDTDGIDGMTDACGAIGDASTLEKARRLGLSIRGSLATNSSYDFFKATGDLIYTGPTGTNVSDLRVVLTGRR